MKRSRLIQICILCSLCIGFVFWTFHASGQGTKGPASVEQDMDKYMPILRGDQWLKLDPNSKVAFIWGAAHVILIEAILMENFPELKVENFSRKVVEARVSKGDRKMTINQIISTIDQYYKDNPGKLNTAVMRVIWDVGIKPYVKTNIAGRPLK